MFKSLAILAALVASVSAFTVTVPNSSKNFTTDGQNTVSWTSVSTDRKNFTIVLSNGNPGDDQILDALVDTTDGTASVNAPSEGWPAAGAGPYTINLCADSESLSTILAQSSKFFFAAPKISASPSPSATAQQQQQQQSTNAPASTPTDAADTNSSATDSATAPSGTSGALPAMSLNAGILAFALVLSAMFV